MGSTYSPEGTVAQHRQIVGGRLVAPDRLATRAVGRRHDQCAQAIGQAALAGGRAGRIASIAIKPYNTDGGGSLDSEITTWERTDATMREARQDGPLLQHLPRTHLSLAHGVEEASKEGTLYVLSVAGGVRRQSAPEATVTFGRNLPEVNVLVGPDDRNVSRLHGVVHYADGLWSLRNTGKRNLQLPGTMQLFPGAAPFPLPAGYTPVFIRTSPRRTHLIELYISDGSGGGTRAAYEDPTFETTLWPLTRTERLAVVATAQPYLLYEEHPEPWSRGAVASLLQEIDPESNWNKPKVGRVVDGVRARLAGRGVSGLTEDEVGSPVGNRLKHNLIVELMASHTIIPPDLELLD